MLPEIQSFINSANTENTFIPPTEVYNEGFLLRVIFQFALDHPGIDYGNEDVNLILGHPPGTRFFCEGHLYSHFRKRIDKDLYESDTQADGIVGDFTIRDGTKTRIIVDSDARHFAVIEAKMNAKLSKRITNASFYDQAARNIACIAETFFDAGLEPNKLDRIGFYIIAPEQKISEGTFESQLDISSIDEKILRRIAQYGPEHQEELMDWYNNWVVPTLENIMVKQISWEQILGAIVEKYPDRTDLEEFYERCLEFNGL